MNYPVIIEPAAEGYAASPVQFSGFAVAKTKEEVLKLAAEQVALALLEEGNAVPPDESEIDLSEYEAGSEIVLVEPAAVNPVSLSIEQEIEKRGLTQSEVARRAGMPRSVVSRLTNPFYFGHSIKSLNELAAALESYVEVSFVPTNRGGDGHRASGERQQR